MTGAIAILAVPGWSFDGSFWGAVRQRMPERRWMCADADVATVLSGTGEPVVAVGHSAGVMRLLRQMPREEARVAGSAAGAAGRWRGLVAINGFARFTAGPGFPAGVPRRMLDRMMGRLPADPEAVVADFRRRCGGEEGAAGPIDPDRLLAELTMLRDDDLRREWWSAGVPRLSIEGGLDPIVGASHAREALPGLGPDARAILPEGGHLMPLQHADWVADRLRAFLSGLAAS
ncbi:alpha/beta fold hydrolase [Rhizosaccharibacter radicis]|uniref:Alpha/beta hydrolase n=1 Tax=Rhizosaccharibacter radicis TaxID=2782605 RepID=A0ABT1VVK2_9PROT|nr:alpha/beta hydrolase [Acetobacteraceae bacterium KSS12]